MDKQAEIEKQMLELQQKAKKVELAAKIEKLKVEQEALEEEEEEEEEEEGEADRAMERVKDWLETQPAIQVPVAKEEKPQLEDEQNEKPQQEFSK